MLHKQSWIVFLCILKTDLRFFELLHIPLRGSFGIPAQSIFRIQFKTPVVVLKCFVILAKCIVVIHPPDAPCGRILWIGNYHLIEKTLAGIDLISKLHAGFFCCHGTLRNAPADKKQYKKKIIRGKKSFINVIQFLGRVVRKNEAFGSFRLFIDFIDTAHPILKKHSEERIQACRDIGAEVIIVESIQELMKQVVSHYKQSNKQ